MYLKKFEFLPDVLYLDPPWKVGIANPTRGLAINYDMMSVEEIKKLPVSKLVKNGLVLLWVTKSSKQIGIDWLKELGGKLQGEITWIKLSENNKLQSNVSGMLRSAKEILLVFKFGDYSKRQKISSLGVDVIFNPRLKRNQKPDEIYIRLEEIFENGRFLEVFGRNNNVRVNWTTIGNQLERSCSYFEL